MKERTIRKRRRRRSSAKLAGVVLALSPKSGMANITSWCGHEDAVAPEELIRLLCTDADQADASEGRARRPQRKIELSESCARDAAA